MRDRAAAFDELAGQAQLDRQGEQVERALGAHLHRRGRRAAPAPGDAGLADQRRGLDLEPRRLRCRAPGPTRCRAAPCRRETRLAGPRHDCCQAAASTGAPSFSSLQVGRRRRDGLGGRRPDHRLPGRMAHLGQPLRCVVDAHLQRDRRRTARRRRAGRSSRSSPSAGRRPPRRRFRAARRSASAAPGARRVERQAEARRVAALPRQMPLRADVDDLGMDARIADGVVLDAQVEARRRTAAQGMARRPPARPAPRARASTGHGGVGELGDRERAASRSARGDIPAGSRPRRPSCRSTPRSQALSADRRPVARRKHRARRGEPADARVDAGERGFELRGASAPAPRRPPLRPRPRLPLLQLLARAMGKLVQLQRRTAPRVAKDLGGPGERRLAVERRTPDAPQAGVARQIARHRAGRACAPAASPPRRMPASGRRAARSAPARSRRGRR